MSDQFSVAHFVCSSIGGAAHHIDHLLKYLSKSYRSTLIAPNDGTPSFLDQVQGRSSVHVDFGYKTQFSWGTMPVLRQHLKASEPDILHLHGTRAAILGRLASLGLGSTTRNLYTVHGFHFAHHPKIRRILAISLEKLLSRRTARYICVSQTDASHLVDFKIAEASRIDIILNGVEPPERDESAIVRVEEELEIDQGCFIITTVCRLHPQKDLETLISAFSSLPRNENIRLLIVGEGPLRIQLENQVRQLRLDSRVTLTGHRDDISAILAKTDLFCLSSRWEGTSLVLLEAMASSLPVIASDIPGLREVVVEKQTGFLVPQNPPAWEEKILYCLENPRELRKLGKAGYQRYQELFTARTMTVKTEAVYRRLLADRR